MGNFKVNLTENQYYQIRDFYKQSDLEQCGVMFAKLDDDNIIIKDIDFFSSDMLENATEEMVIIKDKTLENALLYTIGNAFNVMIFFHTHPSVKGVSYLSVQDKKVLKRETEIFNKCKYDLIALEGIVTFKGINFFIWDEKKDDAIRVDCFVDGKLEQDVEKKNLLQIFLDSFNEGRYKSKKLNSNLKK